MKRAFAAVSSFVLLLLLMAWMAGRFEDRIPPGRADAPAAAGGADAVTVHAEIEPVLEQAVGTVRARDEIVVSSRITARIVAVEVRAGDAVRRGDVLVRLDDAELAARVEQQRDAVRAARAAAEEAEPAFRRVQSLFERGTVPRSELERVEATLRAARAALSRSERAVEEAEAALGYARLTAIRDARVVERYAEPGDTAIPGTPLVRLYDPASLRVEASVRESLATRLAPGDAVQVAIDALQRRVSATVDEIVPSADPGSRTFTVKALLPADLPLFPGMFARLLIVAGEERRLYVPSQALLHVGQLAYVRAVEDGAPVLRLVRTGRADEARVEVLAGLRDGERILPDAGSR